MRRFDELDSTNRYLVDEARAGAPEGVVAVAERQGSELRPKLVLRDA